MNIKIYSISQCLLKSNNISHNNKIKIKNLRIKKIKTVKINIKVEYKYMQGNILTVSAAYFLFHPVGGYEANFLRLASPFSLWFHFFAFFCLTPTISRTTTAPAYTMIYHSDLLYVQLPSYS